MVKRLRSKWQIILLSIFLIAMYGCQSSFMDNAALLSSMGNTNATLSSSSSGKFSKTIGPDFTLFDLNGEKITLSEYIGKGPVLLEFWATWCPHCKQRIPYIKKMLTKYESKGLKFFAINSGEDKDLVVQYAKEQEIQYPILLDPGTKVRSSYYELFNWDGVPTFILIDKAGKIQYIAYAIPGDNIINEVL